MDEIVLTLHLLDEFDYQSGRSSVPFVASIEVKEPTEIDALSYVNTAMLTAASEEDRWFGFSRSIFRRFENPVLVMPGRPLLIPANVFQDEDSVEGFLPGEYELFVKVTVVRHSADDDRKAFELRATRRLRFD